MQHIKLIDSVEVHNSLGECVIWDESQQAVWWTDIEQAQLYRYATATQCLTAYSLPERLASFGFTDREGWLICGFESGLALYQPATAHIDWIARPEKDSTGLRFNDGRVDRQGRFWTGTMVEQKSISQTGALYCLEGRRLKKILTDIKIPNSICWSLDSSRFYFADSPAYRICAYEFNKQDGSLGEFTSFAQTAAPYEPDGSAVDAEDHVWNALWGGGKVVRYSPNGQVSLELPLPISQPTCVAFGGADMNWLFVTSANTGLTRDQKKNEPHAGNVFIFQTPYKGVLETRFKI